MECDAEDYPQILSFTDEETEACRSSEVTVHNSLPFVANSTYCLETSSLLLSPFYWEDQLTF